ncbi:MAG: hypothetical protein ABH846_04130, partial [Patescibacteria group bacterium]
STFTKVEQKTYDVKRKFSPEEVIGVLFSSSFSSPDMFIRRTMRFESKIRAVLAEYLQNNQVEKTEKYYLLIGRRI